MQISRTIFRALFCLIPAILIMARIYYLAPPADGGPPGPGEGIFVLVDAFFSTVLFLPMMLVAWYYGFRGVRFHKTLLGIGIFLTELPLIGMGAVYVGWYVLQYIKTHGLY